jgi:hypothetical protein
MIVSIPAFYVHLFSKVPRMGSRVAFFAVLLLVAMILFINPAQDEHV